MKKELCEMSTWKKFLESLQNDAFNRFWVAKVRDSGDVIATIGAVAIREGDQTLHIGCGWKRNWKIQFESKKEQQIFVEIKVRFCYNISLPYNR